MILNCNSTAVPSNMLNGTYASTVTAAAFNTDEIKSMISLAVDAAQKSDCSAHRQTHKETVVIEKPQVAKVETYNNKVVKMTFADGSFTRAVCSDVDSFSVDVGITICLFKKMLGTEGHKLYNKMMKDVHKLMLRQTLEKAEEREQKEMERRKAERAKERAARRKEQAREDYIDAHVEALRRWHAENK